MLGGEKMKVEVVKWFLAGVVVVVLNLLLTAIGTPNLMSISWVTTNLSNLVIGIIGWVIYGWLLYVGLGIVEKIKI